jgi:hypothetical protein
MKRLKEKIKIEENNDRQKGSITDSFCSGEMPLLGVSFHTSAQECIAHLWIQSTEHAQGVAANKQ